jgi:hypothetical protein
MQAVSVPALHGPSLRPLPEAAADACLPGRYSFRLCHLAENSASWPRTFSRNNEKIICELGSRQSFLPVNVVLEKSLVVYTVEKWHKSVRQLPSLLPQWYSPGAPCNDCLSCCCRRSGWCSGAARQGVWLWGWRSSYVAHRPNPVRVRDKRQVPRPIPFRARLDTWTTGVCFEVE